MKDARYVEERAGEIWDVEMGGDGGTRKGGRSEWREIRDVRGSVPEFGWQQQQQTGASFASLGCTARQNSNQTEGLSEPHDSLVRPHPF